MKRLICTLTEEISKDTVSQSDSLSDCVLTGGGKDHRTAKGLFSSQEEDTSNMSDPEQSCVHQRLNQTAQLCFSADAPTVEGRKLQTVSGSVGGQS